MGETLIQNTMKVHLEYSAVLFQKVVSKLYQ